MLFFRISRHASEDQKNTGFVEITGKIVVPQLDIGIGPYPAPFARLALG